MQTTPMAGTCSCSVNHGEFYKTEILIPQSFNALVHILGAGCAFNT